MSVVSAGESGLVSAVRVRVWLTAVRMGQSGSLTAVRVGQSGSLTAVSVGESGWVSAVSAGKSGWVSAVRMRVLLSAVRVGQSDSLTAVSAWERRGWVSGVRVRETGYVSVLREGQRVSASLHSRAVVSCQQRPKSFVQLGSVSWSLTYSESRSLFRNLFLTSAQINSSSSQKLASAAK